MSSFPSIPPSPGLSFLHLSSVLLSSSLSRLPTFLPTAPSPFPRPHLLCFPLLTSLRLSQAWLMVCWGEADGRWVRDCPCQPLTLGPIQAGEMIDVKSNFKHPQFNSGRQTESGGQRLATQLGHPDKTYGSSLPAGVFVCMRVAVCVAFFLQTAYLTVEPSVLYLKGSWRALLYRQGGGFLRAPC